MTFSNTMLSVTIFQPTVLLIVKQITLIDVAYTYIIKYT